MDRLTLLVIACVALVGCQTPYYPLTGQQSTRVPAPPTGIIGNGDYYSATPAPPAGRYPPAGTSYLPPSYGPGEQVTSVGASRYWESREGVREDRPQQVATARSVANNNSMPQQPLASTRTSSDAATRATSSAGLTRNERLSWREPSIRETNVPANNIPYSQFARNSPPVAAYDETNIVGSGYVPGYLPNPGYVSPLRVRGFPAGYNRREVVVEPQLAEFLENGVRQASATSTWQPRYDDVKR